MLKDKDFVQRLHYAVAVTAGKLWLYRLQHLVPLVPSTAVYYWCGLLHPLYCLAHRNEVEGGGEPASCGVGFFK